MVPGPDHHWRGRAAGDRRPCPDRAYRLLDHRTAEIAFCDDPVSLPEVEGIERAALARMAKKPHEEEPSEATVVVMNFEGARLTDAPRRAQAASSRVTAQQF